ncbi:MAG: tetratricopeptide repeat protein [Gemmatimonadaceae bacterium]|nr:tetratricopeptide repeat protein [Gemmatimonadaceae bacterium]
MATPFLSSEEYDERAHQLYSEGQYDEALDVLREGLSLYPNSVELHIGVGYARLAREEYAWARRAFEEALVLEPEHEDALAGLGETLLKLGQRDAALRCMKRTLELGYADDIDLMLQIGRALFREGEITEARDYFEAAMRHAPDSAEVVSCVGYVEHRLGDDEAALATLRKALQHDAEYHEARIYLANVLYDRGDYEAALYHLEQTKPEDHWDELAIWRLLEMKRSLFSLPEGDPELKPWEERLVELGGEMDDIDEMLAEIEGKVAEELEQQRGTALGQLELFGALLADLAAHRGDDAGTTTEHAITTHEGKQFAGTWEQIVQRMRESNGNGARSLHEYMIAEARRGFSLTGVRIPTNDAEAFIRGSADAGLLRIVR